MLDARSVEAATAIVTLLGARGYDCAIRADRIGGLFVENAARKRVWVKADGNHGHASAVAAAVALQDGRPTLPARPRKPVQMGVNRAK